MITRQDDDQVRPAMLGVYGRRRSGFTLVEVMIVVAIIAVLAAIALPGLRRARMRTQATRVKNDLRLIDGAVSLYAIENVKGSGAVVAVDDWSDYMKEDSPLYLTSQDVFGREYADQLVDRLPTVPAATYDELSEVAGAEFWRPFVRETVAQPTTKRKVKKKN